MRRILSHFYSLSLQRKSKFLEEELKKQELYTHIQRFNENGQNGKNFIVLDFNSKNKPTVVISAHYDGVGAYDNAGGVITLLWLIRWIRLDKVNLKSRFNLLPVFFDGEEKGLLGVRHFFQDDLLKNISIYGHISLDGFGIGLSIGGFANLKRMRLMIGSKKKVLTIQADTTVFQNHRIPSLHLFTLPEDELSQLIFGKIFPNSWRICHTNKDTPDKIEEEFIPYIALELYKKIWELDFHQKGIITIGE